jgi:hypothetical protein
LNPTFPTKHITCLSCHRAAKNAHAHALPCRHNLRQANLCRLWRPGRRMRPGQRQQPWIARQIMRALPLQRLRTQRERQWRFLRLPQVLCYRGSNLMRVALRALPVCWGACIWASWDGRRRARSGGYSAPPCTGPAQRRAEGVGPARLRRGAGCPEGFCLRW